MQAQTERSEQTEAVAIIIPTLNESVVLPRLLPQLRALRPAPFEIIAVDGGSQDNTAETIKQSRFVRLIEHSVRGRAAQINRGVTEARSSLICVLHADTILPADAVAVIRAPCAMRALLSRDSRH